MKYRLLIILLSIKWTFRVNIGDYIWYKGKKYTVANGVRPYSWRLHELNNSDDGWVKRTDCRKVWTLQNMIGSFKSGHQFYMTAWYGIWKNSGIKKWMRKCNIW